MSGVAEDLQNTGLYASDDFAQKLTPEEEIEMLLNRALRDCKLGYMAATSTSVKKALEIFIKLGDKDE
jgi:hypothetical protein